jgi:methionyl aminopeptidase
VSAFQIFTQKEIASVRKGGAILQACLKHAASLVRPGITTEEIDREAEAFIRAKGGTPAFKGYNGFPATLCTSVNDECVHGIPGKRVLKEGDVVSLDGGVLFDELYTDACITVGVGTISADAQRLLSATKEALDKVVAMLKAGVRVGDISSLVQKTVEAKRCHPVRALTGHGLGYELHQFPDIPNLGRAGSGPAIPANTILAIEPIVSLGSDEVQTTGDGWTLVTEDGSMTAHFEHTILVTKEGCEVLA